MNFRVILIFFFALVYGYNAYAIDPVIFTNENKGDYIGKNIAILKDPTRQLTFEDIQQQKGKFVASTQEVPNLGVDPVNNWIRFTLKNESDISKLVVNLSQVDIHEVMFYWVRDGIVDSTNGELRTRRLNFDFNHQFYLFEIPLKKGEEVECYLKLFSHTQLSAPISVHSPNDLFTKLRQSDIFSAIYIGLMLAMILYNVFLYFTTKEVHYFSYVNYIFWVVVAQLAILGLLEPLLGLKNDWITSRLLTLTGAISGIAAIYFVKSFLQTSDNSPRFNYLLNVFVIGYLIAIVLLIAGIITPAYKMVNIVAGGGSTIVLILAFRLSREKYRQTKYFLFAWCIFLISVLVYVMKDYNVLPYNFFTLRSVQIGSVIEAILLSFALGDKINIYRKEKEESQSKALKILLDNERLIREQNTALEIKVKERTKDLTNANESLKSALQHLKDTQSQLVQAEKMASLGQLTAGVAHEINNPINFVTSNVAPLRRDIDMIWEAIHEFEQLALDTVLSKEEKAERITKYKQDLDFDYVKTEVEYLLKGMHEGASRTAEIVKGLRVFSRVDEDTLKSADINEGLESTMVILNSLVKDKVKVIKSYGEIPFVECYAGKLNQVFLNIITNAVYAIDKKYENNIGGELRIETSLADDDNSIEIKISDNGIGIPDHVKEKIFEPFFTTKDVGEGTGLGMSIAYNTINKHNGKIWVESVLGKGSTFHIIIPIKQNA